MRCPACRRNVPVGEIRFEGEHAPEPERFALRRRRKRRLSLSPTAKAFLLVIAVVTVMSWAVRLFQSARFNSPQPDGTAASASGQASTNALDAHDFPGTPSLTNNIDAQKERKAQ